MNDVVLRARIEAEVASARAGIQAVKNDLGTLAKATSDASAAGKTLGASLMIPEPVALSAAPTMIARVGDSAGRSAGQMGNLAAQWNDVIMMTLAGQSPLQMAIQQGSQITQVMGSAGAGGALRMLGASMTSLLNPTNLAVYAAIALGSALVQKLMPSADAAASAEDRLATATKELESNISGLKAITSEFANGDLEALKSKYGEVDAALLSLIAHQREELIIGAQNAAKDAVKALADEYGVASGQLNLFRITGQGAAADIAKALGFTKYEMLAFEQALKDAQSATTFDEQAEALGRVDEYLKRSTINGGELANNVTHAALALRETAQQAETSGDALDKASGKGDGLLTVLMNAVRAAQNLAASEPGGGWLDGAISKAGTLAAKLWDAADAARIAAMQSPYSQPDANGRIVDRAAQNQGMTGRGLPVDYKDPIKPPARIGTGSGGGSVRDNLGSLSNDAKQALAELDIQIAAINEKVRAGLMTTAEGAKAISDAKDKANDDLSLIIAKLEQMGPAGQKAAEGLRTHLVTAMDTMAQSVADFSKTMADGLKSPIEEFIKGTQSGKEAMASFGDFIISTLAKIAADKAVSSFFEPLMNSVFSAIGIPGLTFAQGGVPDAPPLSAYSNSILDKPTLFPMRNGIGLMAEAGKEAIMPVGDGGVLAIMGGREGRLPLARGADGRLGVVLPDWKTSGMDAAPRAFAKGGVLSTGQSLTVGSSLAAPGSAMPPIDIKIITPPGHTGRTQQRTEGGGMQLEVMIEAIEGRMAGNLRAGRGPLNGAITDTFGLPRATR